VNERGERERERERKRLEKGGGGEQKRENDEEKQSKLSVQYSNLVMLLGKSSLITKLDDNKHPEILLFIRRRRK
jgi:hypothetical protein